MDGLLPDERSGERDESRMRGEDSYFRNAQHVTRAGLRPGQVGTNETVANLRHLPTVEHLVGDRIARIRLVH
jgi:hypothetical protein